MHRMLLLYLLYGYKPSKFEDVGVKKRIRDFVQKYPNCFERTLKIGHVTVSAWLLSPDLQSVLLMHHKKLHKWLQFGGHCDGNPNVLAVAIKEAQKESGIMEISLIKNTIFDIDIHRIPERGNTPEHDHYDIRFLLKVAGDRVFQKNEESQQLRWFSVTEPLPSKEESLLRMKKKVGTFFIA
jgi:hypothetical protein